MLRLASVVVCLAVGAGIAAPRGKVVRVERNRGMRVVPRLCDVQPGSKSGLCIAQPTPGERVALIDQERAVVLGEFRIDGTAAETDAFICSGQQPIVFRISGALTAGDPDVIANAGRIVGLRNLSLDPKVARVHKDASVPGTQTRAELGVDVDGNGSLDYALVRYTCDEHGNPAPNNDRRLCFDTYLERGGRLVKAHTDNIQICF